MNLITGDSSSVEEYQSPHNQDAAPFGRLVTEFDGPLELPDSKLAQGLRVPIQKTRLDLRKLMGIARIRIM